MRQLLFAFLIVFSPFFSFAQTHIHSCPGSLCNLLALEQDMRTRVGPPEQLYSRAGTATFEVDTAGYPREVAEAFIYATDIWGSVLVSDVPIKVAFLYWPLVNGPLGATAANAVMNFPGAIDTNTWYASALGDAITGTNQQPQDYDMIVFMNQGANWYFGLDGNTPSGKHDFVSVALHELGHGLGFTSLAKLGEQWRRIHWEDHHS